MQGQESSCSPCEEPFIQNHKLCGFLRCVVSVQLHEQITDFQHHLSNLLPFGTRCYVFGDGADAVGFRSREGVVLSAVSGGGGKFALGRNVESNGDGGVVTPDLGKSKVSESSSSQVGSSRKKRRKLGLVHGSMSVVHQIHLLVMHKCLEIVARVVNVSVREDGNARAVLLVDVYLPVELWSGWRFPKSASTAASLFGHLSCDWEQRTLILAEDGNFYLSLTHEYYETIWIHSDCDVLGCKLHLCTPSSSQKKLYDLHEIFKNLPGVEKGGNVYTTKITPTDASLCSGIWEVSDDIMINILTSLAPRDLVSVSATCRHLRSLAISITPCMKLKLFPHQQAAVEWMLQRELHAEVLAHPLYKDFLTEDGFQFYINIVSGEVESGVAPTFKDFCGGMFCDEPGLGKTITALSLVLKTKGIMAEPPDGVEVTWCTHNNDQRCGYYELSPDKFAPGFMPSWKRFGSQSIRRGKLSADVVTPIESSKSSQGVVDSVASGAHCALSVDSSNINISSSTLTSFPTTSVRRCTRSFGCVQKNLFGADEGTSDSTNKRKSRNNTNDRGISNGRIHAYLEKEASAPSRLECSPKKPRKAIADHLEHKDSWVQCDACGKWRKLPDASFPDATAAWFCSMNSDFLHQNCAIPQESLDYKQSITCLPGFCSKGTSGGREENVMFFTGVLKDHNIMINSETKKALTWLAKLSPHQLLQMEKNGLTRPVLDTHTFSVGDAHAYHKIFKAFGLIKRVERETTRWYYPNVVDDLVFDVVALQIALTKPLNLFRLYLSRATLIVVPANLVDHWKTQIRRHVRSGHLRVFVWTESKKLSAHNLAWDYDVVITTFSRLSAEWGPRKRSVLMQVHWLRVILDEGHTLGSSLNLTNKFQMAISLTTSKRWILTGTPTPNTPNSQVSHLQPMFKFLHEEVYGQNQKSWEAGVLRPFEAEMEEGRERLVQLLHRCMISARKIDLHTIPPCVKKVVFLDFLEEHAKSYNELVVTVRRNILMADWNDPSHVESLLNPKQWKFRSTTIRNVRLSCCVAGHIKVTDAGQEIQETMDILVNEGLDPVSEEYIFIKLSLLDGVSCFRCKEWCRLPVITPCRHLLCLDCVSLDSERCTFPGCDNCYEMQSPEILTRPENPNPKWPVPKDLIELQPSYKQDDWDPDWHSTSSSKVAYLVERLKVIQECNKKLWYSTIEGKTDTPCDELLLPEKSHWSLVPYREVCTNSNEKSSTIAPEKVIIFSQFLEHIHIIEEQLTGAGIKFAGMYSPMPSSNKMKSLANFQHHDDCMALLMDGSAALGLDLSFVTHVFLMEPIWDRSMEEQVISRAHRMGATRPINVETLAMRGTIEEQMVEFLQDADDCKRDLKEELRVDNEVARVRRTLHDFAENNYLSQLSFVRTVAKT